MQPCEHRAGAQHQERSNTECQRKCVQSRWRIPTGHSQYQRRDVDSKAY